MLNNTGTLNHDKGEKLKGICKIEIVEEVTQLPCTERRGHASVMENERRADNDGGNIE